MSERSDARLALRGGWFTSLCRVLAVTAAFAVLGPPVHATVYFAASIGLDWWLGRGMGTLGETFLSFVQAVYTYAAPAAAVIGAAIGLWHERHDSGSWVFALCVAPPVGIANLGYLTLIDPDPQPQPAYSPLAVLGTLHGVTWGAAALLCWAMITRIGARWLSAGKASPK
jgi:hypothetical protein